ncbi:MAG TPA: class I SAM-dependent methyltransferase [Cyanobacteria bacterium UBA8803]|nr:class I SAM-dependent methyltransferase [Cyanobacteria bacterium UBA9273]HBL57833.1 class I SAM-dependent methyltransferase [Cyanobacteria bacterium UBA8803]
MQLLLRKAVNWVYTNDSFVKDWRSKRMLSFLKLVKPPSHARIVDLGGSPYIWKLIEHNFDITLVNLPENSSFVSFDIPPKFRFIKGDVTDISNLFEDKSFDVVFSNSTIEHVGDEEKQASFASEVMRLANSYWVQTPSINFPLEPHTGVPFYWQLPDWWRRHLHDSWRKKLPVWTKSVEDTRVLTCLRMRELFPEAEIYVERLLFLEKSYSFYKAYSSD